MCLKNAPLPVLTFQQKSLLLQKKKKQKEKGCGNMENSTEFTIFPHLKQQQLF